MAESPTKQREGDQPLPVKNDLPFVQDAVIADIEKRKEIGIQRYGTPLQAFNGRDTLQDLFEELLDGAMYAKQLMIERDATEIEWSVLFHNGQRMLTTNEEEARRISSQYLDSKVQSRSQWKDS